MTHPIDKPENRTDHFVSAIEFTFRHLPVAVLIVCVPVVVWMGVRMVFA